MLPGAMHVAGDPFAPHHRPEAEALTSPADAVLLHLIGPDEMRIVVALFPKRRHPRKLPDRDPRKHAQSDSLVPLQAPHPQKVGGVKQEDALIIQQAPLGIIQHFPKACMPAIRVTSPILAAQL